MRTNDHPEHPEVIELMHICAVSPDVDSTKEVCEVFKGSTKKKRHSKDHDKRNEQLNKESDLDRDLEATFPASDATAHY